MLSKAKNLRVKVSKFEFDDDNVENEIQEAELDYFYEFFLIPGSIIVKVSKSGEIRKRPSIWTSLKLEYLFLCIHWLHMFGAAHIQLCLSV